MCRKRWLLRLRLHRVGCTGFYSVLLHKTVLAGLDVQDLFPAFTPSHTLRSLELCRKSTCQQAGAVPRASLCRLGLLRAGTCSYVTSAFFCRPDCSWGSRGKIRGRRQSRFPEPTAEEAERSFPSLLNPFRSSDVAKALRAVAADAAWPREIKIPDGFINKCAALNYTKLVLLSVLPPMLTQTCAVKDVIQRGCVRAFRGGGAK